MTQQPHYSHENLRGILFMMASMAGYTLNDSMVKLVSSDLGLYQVVFVRGLVATALLGLLAWHKGSFTFHLSPRDRLMIALRTLTEIGATFCFLTALFHLPLANATAIMQSLPLSVTLAASIFLGHKVGWKRYVAIAVGFTGVLIIIRPGTEGFNGYSLWAVAAVALVTARDLISHRMSSKTPAIFVAFVTALGVTVYGGVFSIGQPWAPVSLSLMGILSIAAVFILIGYISAITAMQHGEIAFVAPFRYSALIWALLLGFVLFGDIPDGYTIIGSIIVVLTGIYTFYRERIISQQEQRLKTQK